ncbi:MAG: hypothetical protein AAGD11_06470 [Planctomycetota bacterium]
MQKSIVGLMIVMLTTIGCGGQDATAPATPQAVRPKSQSAPPSDPIARVAYDFFDAVLTSDRDAARAQLTTVAVRRLAELGMDFLLPVSESSSFRVGPAQVIEEGMAAVDAILTEADASGEPIREEITVVLRLERGRWGVMGVVTGMGPNEQLDGFNFEKPDQPFNESSFDRQPTTNIASSPPPTNTVPQQAVRPRAKDRLRQ